MHVDYRVSFCRICCAIFIQKNKVHFTLITSTHTSRQDAVTSTPPTPNTHIHRPFNVFSSRLVTISFNNKSLATHFLKNHSVLLHCEAIRWTGVCIQKYYIQHLLFLDTKPLFTPAQSSWTILSAAQEGKTFTNQRISSSNIQPIKNLESSLYKLVHIEAEQKSFYINSGENSLKKNGCNQTWVAPCTVVLSPASSSACRIYRNKGVKRRGGESNKQFITTFRKEALQRRYIVQNLKESKPDLSGKKYNFSMNITKYRIFSKR